jgi:hypothetical protein
MVCQFDESDWSIFEPIRDRHKSQGLELIGYVAQIRR